MYVSRALPLVSLTLGVVLSAMAQTPTPPPQPSSGPGGSAYAYPSYQQFGAYYVNPNKEKSYATYYIFEPAGSSTPASLPVVLFLHGYLAGREGYTVGDSPSNYIYWIEHIVRNGYTVVFPTYDATLSPPEFCESIVSAWESALSRLQSGKAGMIPPTIDGLGMQTAFTGHSMGAYESFAVAQSLTTNPVAGVPVPRAIAAFNPGLGNTGTIQIALSQISPAISVVMTDADENTPDIPTAQSIWSSIGSAIPAANRDFLEVITDTHGSPAQLGNHWFPDTNGLEDDDSGVDDRDYNITWKLSVGLFDCVLTGTNCSYGLGHGSFNQINMGVWSDGTPVNTLSLQNPN
jgi:acetyl esterase/lipase